MTATNQDLISRVLNLYYVDELTQAEVGKRLGLSTAKVNRLLQQARQQGMVEITIRTPLQHLYDLEDRLKAIFDIQEAVVIPRIAEDGRSAALVDAEGTVRLHYRDLVAWDADGHHLQARLTPGPTGPGIRRTASMASGASGRTPAGRAGDSIISMSNGASFDVANSA